jgi:hypothetical protein
MRHLPSTLVLIGIALLLLPVQAMAQGRPGDCGFYNFGRAGISSGRQCSGTMQSPPPQRVTALCRDGSYSYDQGRGVCGFHGGVIVWRQ